MSDTRQKNETRISVASSYVRYGYLMIFLLIFLTYLAFHGLPGHDFLAIDDNVYVTDNPFVQKGLTRSTICWAFTTLDAEFWHPLTWLSLMLDTTLFRGEPGGYLSTNLMLHMLNTLILFFLLLKMTGKRWRAFFVAALFSIHPLHVESVAWISERKDLLSTFFSLIAMVVYWYYTQKNTFFFYFLLLLFFILGLMAKPTLVTLPFLLIVLDYWPLGRLSVHGKKKEVRQSVMPLIIEKIPLMGIALFFSLITLLAQGKGGGIVPLSDFSFFDRIQNAVVAYATYIFKMFWPENLAVFYPVKREISALFFLFNLSLLGGIGGASVFYYRSKPYMITGVLWFSGTLFPMIGLVKIGNFAMADRFTYVPLIGLFILLVWLVSEWVLIHKRWILPVRFGTILLLLLFSFMTYKQTTHWKDTFSLFSHATRVTRDNDFCNYHLGRLYAGRNNIRKAIHHFKESVRIRPEVLRYQADLGRILIASGDFKGAVEHLNEACLLNPDHEATLFYLGIVHVALKREEKVRFFFSQLLKRLKKKADPSDHARIDTHLELILKHPEEENNQNIYAILNIVPEIEAIKKDAEKGYANWRYLKEKGNLLNHPWR